MRIRENGYLGLGNTKVRDNGPGIAKSGLWLYDLSSSNTYFLLPFFENSGSVTMEIS